MKADKSRANAPSGEFMIQDNDHMVDRGQVGNQANQSVRQPDQSQAVRESESHQSGQQGGERNHRKGKKR